MKNREDKNMRNYLRPGEIKILKALREGPKSFSELHGLNTNVLSEYLKSLQLSGLIQRDIETRKYLVIDAGIQAVNLEDRIQELREEFWRAHH
jgi:DNA-binding IclR family transcriptional regulator